MESIFDQIIGTVNKSTPQITLESLTTIAEINGMSIETDSYEEDSASMLADAMEAMGVKVKYDDDLSASEIAALEKEGATFEDPDDDDDETVEEMASGFIDEYYETEKDDALSALSDADLDDIDDDFEGGYESHIQNKVTSSATESNDNSIHYEMENDAEDVKVPADFDFFAEPSTEGLGIMGHIEKKMAYKNRVQQVKFQKTILKTDLQKIQQEIKKLKAEVKEMRKQYKKNGRLDEDYIALEKLTGDLSRLISIQTIWLERKLYIRSIIKSHGKDDKLWNAYLNNLDSEHIYHKQDDMKIFHSDTKQDKESEKLKAEYVIVMNELTTELESHDKEAAVIANETRQLVSDVSQLYNERQTDFNNSAPSLSDKAKSAFTKATHNIRTISAKFTGLNYATEGFTLNEYEDNDVASESVTTNNQQVIENRREAISNIRDIINSKKSSE